MAIVPNLANGQVDKSYCTHNRVSVVEPNGVLTPEYAGEIVLDTGGNAYWKAMGVANDTWVALTPPN